MKADLQRRADLQLQAEHALLQLESAVHEIDRRRGKVVHDLRMVASVGVVALSLILLGLITRPRRVAGASVVSIRLALPRTRLAEVVLLVGVAYALRGLARKQNSLPRLRSIARRQLSPSRLS